VLKNNLRLARLPGMSETPIKNYRHYNFQAFANISGNFSENIKFRENLQP